MAEKSILEQALLQVQTLEEAVKQNAKGILSSTMKEELSELLKESEEEAEEVQADESLDATEMEATEEEKTEESTPEEEAEEDMSEQPESDEDSEEEDSEEEDLDNDEELDGEDLDSEDELDGEDLDSEDEVDSEFGSEMGGEELPMDSEDGMGSDMGDEMDSDMGDDSLDMTGASDEEVLKVFKAMGPEDGVVVRKDGDNVEIETGDEEFIIKLNEQEETSEEVSEEESTEEEWNESEDEQDEETIYEIELDETDEEVEESTHKEEATEARQGALKGLGSPKKQEPKESREGALKGLGSPKKQEPKESRQGALKGLGSPKKQEPKEAARTQANDVRGIGPRQGKKYKAGRPELNEQIETLKKQNGEYKKALVLFKEKLNEVAVFNANLAYATRLFTEHSTTKKEKMDILKRFDTVISLNESKSLYNTIKSELESKKPVTESVVEKISSTPTTSSSEVLSESRVYENPQFRRMKDLMGKIK